MKLLARNKDEQNLAAFETSRPESLTSSVVDTVVLAAGHWCETRWNETGSRRRQR